MEDLAKLVSVGPVLDEPKPEKPETPTEEELWKEELVELEVGEDGNLQLALDKLSE